MKWYLPYLLLGKHFIFICIIIFKFICMIIIFPRSISFMYNVNLKTINNRPIQSLLITVGNRNYFLFILIK